MNRWRVLRVPMLLGVLCLVIYNANLRQIGAGDTYAARYQPLGIWRFGTVKLDPIIRWVAHGHPSDADWKHLPSDNVSLAPWAYWIAHARNHHFVSLYPVVAPILVAPLYLPAVVYLAKHDWQQPAVDRVAELMEKLSASILATLTAIAFYLLLRREGNRWALVLALALAFGTNTWMISSQALWQHGAGEFLIAIALLLAFSRPTIASTAGLGAVAVLAAASRPPDALLAGAIVLHAMWTRRRTVPWLLAGAAVPLAAILFYNFSVVGNFAGGYGTAPTRAATFFQHPILPGVAGLLVSPARGLLVFTPFLLFVPLGIRERLRESGTRSLSVALIGAIGLQLLLYAPTDWRAGFSWGPRYLTDMLPVLVWLLAPALLVVRAVGRALLFLAMVASVIVQVIGAFWYTGASDIKIFAAGMRGAWDLANTPFLVELQHGRPPAELQCNATALIDRMGGTAQPGANVALPVLGAKSRISGWALACGRTPAQLYLLIDGVIIGTTQQFTERPDVASAMHATARCGWAITADTSNALPGERVLQVALRLEPGSSLRIVHEQRVKVMKDEMVSAHPAESSTELAAMADVAASTLSSHLSPEGYWLTSYTSQARFEAPREEMNTFLTSMMVDFISPISHEYKLDDVLQRARQHLAAQIESNGLVRYHGLPDAPTIGSLGCVITPDADDTALVWRIAGSNGDARRQPMLNELAAFRNARGLYQTWLAPREKYQCLDPGHDPDPADATIQMHVYMMLRQFDPPAAEELCSALKREIGSEEVWVYYAKAPLIPFLRGAELRSHGCDLALPLNLLSWAVSGQQIWSDLARQLARSNGNTTDRKALEDLLARLGQDNFAELRRTPPLLYHNDLTATVGRYYWSEDFGYALWLRAYTLWKEMSRAPAATP